MNVKIHNIPLAACLFALIAPSQANPASKSDVRKATPPAAPAYKEESPLPKGWPEPGPFDQVVRKKFPASRAAYTKEGSPNGAFMKLFRHIQRNDIPMTAPVEMKMDESGDKGMKMERMAFLYQSPEVGKTGADGVEVEVLDVPAMEALSYAWQGARDDKSTAKARQALDAELAAKNLKSSGYRLLGYNSPFVPRSKQTHELQAILE